MCRAMVPARGAPAWWSAADMRSMRAPASHSSAAVAGWAGHAREVKGSPRDAVPPPARLATGFGQALEGTSDHPVDLAAGLGQPRGELFRERFPAISQVGRYGVVLAAKVIVEGPLGHPGAQRDRVDGGSPEAVESEPEPRGLEDHRLGPGLTSVPIDNSHLHRSRPEARGSPGRRRKRRPQQPRIP